MRERGVVVVQGQKGVLPARSGSAGREGVASACSAWGCGDVTWHHGRPFKTAGRVGHVTSPCEVTSHHGPCEVTSHHGPGEVTSLHGQPFFFSRFFQLTEFCALSPPPPPQFNRYDGQVAIFIEHGQK